MEFIHRNTHHRIGQLILKGIHNKEMEHWIHAPTRSPVTLTLE